MKCAAVCDRILRASPRRLVCSGLLTVVLASSGSACVAQTNPSLTLTGDWGGARTRLIDQGIDLSGGYTSEIANNLRGGTSEETRYTDQWVLSSDFNLQKLFGINDAEFKITITDRNGQDLGARCQPAHARTGPGSLGPGPDLAAHPVRISSALVGRRGRSQARSPDRGRRFCVVQLRVPESDLLRLAARQSAAATSGTTGR